MEGELKYTKEHEWLSEEGGEVTVGITQFAASQLGDIVFVELPEVGTRFECGSEVAVIESVKAASEILAPASGTISAVNEAVAENPSVITEDPLDAGWFFKMRFEEPGQLGKFMSEDEYNAHIA